MKPEQLPAFVERMDSDGTDRQSMMAARAKCAEGTSRVLKGFLGLLLVIAAPEPLLTSAEEAAVRAARGVSLDDGVRVVLRAMVSRRFGPGHVVATVRPRFDGPGEVTYGHLLDARPIDYAVAYRFETARGDTAPYAEGELFSWGQVMDGLHNPTDLTRQNLNDARHELALMEATASDTRPLLEASARDASLNPGLAARFQAFAPHTDG